MPPIGDELNPFAQRIATGIRQRAEERVTRQIDELAEGKTPLAQRLMRERGILPKVDMGESLQRLADEPARMVPGLSFVWAGTEAAADYKAASRVQRGRGTEGDWNRTLRTMVDASRGRTFGAKVAELGAELPAYAVEFGLGMGAAKVTVGRAVTKALGEAALARARQKLAGRLALGAAEVGVQQAGELAAEEAARILGGGGGRAYADAYERAIQRGQPRLARDEAGSIRLTFDETIPEFFDALPEAVQAGLIEKVSERSGWMLGAAARGAGRAARVTGIPQRMAQLPPITRIRAAQLAVARAWANANPDQGIAGLARKIAAGTAWNGPFGEVFEERVGAAMRAGTGLGTWEEVIPELDDALAELTAFSLPTAASVGMQAAAGLIERPGVVTVPQEPAPAAERPAEAERGEGLEPPEVGPAEEEPPGEVPEGAPPEGSEPVGPFPRIVVHPEGDGLAVELEEGQFVGTEAIGEQEAAEVGKFQAFDEAVRAATALGVDWQEITTQDAAFDWIDAQEGLEPVAPEPEKEGPDVQAELAAQLEPVREFGRLAGLIRERIDPGMGQWTPEIEAGLRERAQELAGQIDPAAVRAALGEAGVAVVPPAVQTALAALPEYQAPAEPAEAEPQEEVREPLTAEPAGEDLEALRATLQRATEYEVTKDPDRPADKRWGFPNPDTGKGWIGYRLKRDAVGALEAWHQDMVDLLAQAEKPAEAGEAVEGYEEKLASARKMVELYRTAEVRKDTGETGKWVEWRIYATDEGGGVLVGPHQVIRSPAGTKSLAEGGSHFKTKKAAEAARQAALAQAEHHVLRFTGQVPLDELPPDLAAQLPERKPEERAEPEPPAEEAEPAEEPTEETAEEPTGKASSSRARWWPKGDARAGQKLTAAAEKAKEKAEAEIGAERTENTARRARMAEGIRDRARKEAQVAEAAMAIAPLVTEGGNPLSGFRTLAAVRQLDSATHALRNWKDREPETILRDKLYPFVHTSHLREALNGLAGRAGVKVVRDTLDPLIRYAESRRESIQDPRAIEAIRKLLQMYRQVPEGRSNYGLQQIQDAIRDHDRLRKAGIETTTDLLDAIEAYENLRPEMAEESALAKAKRSLIGTKIPGYFPTPPELTTWAVDLLGPVPGDVVLEPSAGTGALALEVASRFRHSGAGRVVAVEWNATLAEILGAAVEEADVQGVEVVRADFTSWDTGERFDKIVMNPPFEKRQDAAHVRRAYTLLKPGGSLVAIVSAGTMTSSDRPAREFQEWLEGVGAIDMGRQEGAFDVREAERQTGISVHLVMVERPVEGPDQPPAGQEGRFQPTDFEWPAHVTRFAEKVEAPDRAEQARTKQRWERVTENLKEARKALGRTKAHGRPTQLRQERLNRVTTLERDLAELQKKLEEAREAEEGLRLANAIQAAGRAARQAKDADPDERTFREERALLYLAEAAREAPGAPSEDLKAAVEGAGEAAWKEWTHRVEEALRDAGIAHTPEGTEVGSVWWFAGAARDVREGRPDPGMGMKVRHDAPLAEVLEALRDVGILRALTAAGNGAIEAQEKIIVEAEHAVNSLPTRAERPAGLGAELGSRRGNLWHLRRDLREAKAAELAAVVEKLERELAATRAMAARTWERAREASVAHSIRLKEGLQLVYSPPDAPHLEKLRKRSKRHFEGDIGAKDGPYFTDGKVLALKAAMGRAKKSYEKRVAGRFGEEGVEVSAMQKVWDKAVKMATTDVELVAGASTEDTDGVVFSSADRGVSVTIQAAYAFDMERDFGVDSWKASDNRANPVVGYREGKPVAVVMPWNSEEYDPAGVARYLESPDDAEAVREALRQEVRREELRQWGSNPFEQPEDDPGDIVEKASGKELMSVRPPSSPAENDLVGTVPAGLERFGEDLYGSLERPADPAKPVSTQDVIDTLAGIVKASGGRTPIRWGRMGRSSARGFFKVEPEVIRVRTHGNVTTAAHEVGHALEKHLYGWDEEGPWVKGRHAKVPRAIQKELVALGKQLYGDRKPTGGYKREGFAEYVRLWVFAPWATAEEAPKFDRWFTEQFLPGAPAVSKAFHQARAVGTQYRMQGSTTRAAAQVVDRTSLTHRTRDWSARRALHRFVEDWFESGDPLRRLALSAEGTMGREKGQKLMVLASRREELLEQLDELEPGTKKYTDAEKKLDSVERRMSAFEKAAEKLTTTQNPYLLMKALRMTHGARAKSMVEDSMIDIAGNVVGKPLMEIKALVPRNRREDFTIYLWARRAIALWHGKVNPATGETLARPRNPGLSYEDASQVLQELHTERFAEAAELVYRWNDGVLEYLAQSSPSFRPVVARIRKVDPGQYIPLQRVFLELDRAWDKAGPRQGGKIAGTHPVKRLKGSGRPIEDPFQVMVRQAETTIRAAHRRLVLDAVLRLSQIEGMGEIVERVPNDLMKSHEETLGSLMDRINRITFAKSGNLWTLTDEEGRAVAELPEEEQDPEAMSDILGHVLTFWTEARDPKGKDPVLPVWQPNGTIAWYRVDERLFEALQGMDPYRLPHWANLIFGVPTRLFRAGTVTLRPAFQIVTNPIKDLGTLFQQTRSSGLGVRLFFEWIRAYARGALHEASGRRVKDPMLDMTRRLGVEMANFMGQDIDAAGVAARRLFAGRKVEYISPKRWGEALTLILQRYREAIQFPETASRQTEIALVARDMGWDGKRPLTLGESILLTVAGKEGTVDFSAAGRLGRIFNQVVPFFNAALMGQRAVARNLMIQPRRYLLRGAWITTMTLALWWAFRDEDWYQEMDDDERFMSWHIPLGDRTLLRIMRPHETGALFAALPQMLAQAAYDQDPAYMTAWFQQWWDLSFPDLLPPTLAEAKDQWRNRDDFWETPIVPGAYEGLPPAQQFNEYTSTASIKLGELFNVSPMRVDHAVRGLAGGTGPDVLRLFGLGPKPGTRERELADNVLWGRLFQRGGLMGTRPRSVDAVYDRWKETELRARDPRKVETPGERTERLMLGDAAKAISTLYWIRRHAEKTDQRAQLVNDALGIARQALEATKGGVTPRERAPIQGQRRRLERERAALERSME